MSAPVTGSHVTAHPASTRRPVTGTVVELNGPTVVVETSSGMLVAVHVLDCDKTPG